MAVSDITPWLGAVAQAALGLVFLGGMKNEQRNFEKRLQAMDASFEKRIKLLDESIGVRVKDLDERLGVFDQAYVVSLRERSDMAARLKAAEIGLLAADVQRERLIAVTDRTREELTAFRAKSEEQHSAMKDAQERILRALSGMERQLASLSTGRVATYGSDRPPPSRAVGEERER